MTESCDVFDANHQLARTIYVGLDLGGPGENQWAIQLDEHHLDRIAQAGITTVRLAVHFAAHTAL